MIPNALTVDVEDYFQVEAFSRQVAPTTWGQFELRVEHNTHRLLALFSKRGVKATFFVLGWVAERCPGLVRAIAELGHEIACHSYSHQLIYQQDSLLFRQETIRAEECVESQPGQAVEGYRAASYSITKRSLWAPDILAQAGFRYDSSIFPIYHDRYGIPASPRWPYCIKTAMSRTTIEFPPATIPLFRHRIPVGGGGCFRIYPYCITQAALRYTKDRTTAFHVLSSSLGD